MITDDLADLIRDAISKAHAAGELPIDGASVQVAIETPRNKQHGDFSSNVALGLKRATGISDSREIAARIVKQLAGDGSLLDHVEIAGPGFLNFYLKPHWLQDTLVKVESQAEGYGSNRSRAGDRVLLEFVSANPTGPISVVNGRAAALGDVLANLLALQGCEVRREFYVNDAVNSTQIDLFARSVHIRYLQLLGQTVSMPSDVEGEAEVIEPGSDPSLPTLSFPHKGYRGEYVKDIAAAILAEAGPRFKDAPESEAAAYFRSATLSRIIDTQRATLAAFGLHFDNWFFESSLYESDAVDRAIDRLRELGHTYESDGALWFRSTELGDDKDRVLVRSNEKATYIAADLAYHEDKFQRGFNRLIDILGADHHSYVTRLKAGVAGLGHDPDDLMVILTQMVSLVKDGEVVIGGKRKGNVIELKEDLIDDIGKDAARFYFLLNSYDTPATVDVELAKRQSNENPVYYVQYAHARLSNILRKAEEAGYVRRSAAETDRGLLTDPVELAVLRKLSDYPSDVAEAARDCAPHRLTRFGMELASLLNIFYENCRVLPSRDEEMPEELTYARLAMVNGARTVLQNLLASLGIDAPDSM